MRQLALHRATAFLTPIGGAAAPSPAAVPWFPVVGAAIGGCLGLVWWGAGHAWTPEVTAALVVAADLGLTGLLHMDGLVDSADGLLPHLSKERRLEVMREPTIGAFGVTAVVAVLLLRWVALASIGPSPLLLVGLWGASRGCMGAVTAFVPYAREGAEGAGGIATEFVDGARRAPGIVAGVIGLAIGIVCTAVWDLGPGLVALAGGVAAAGLVIWFARRRIGGYTGDVLGAAGIVLETVGLLIAAARW